MALTVSTALDECVEAKLMAEDMLMAAPRIPSQWHPFSYAVDEAEKVVWHRGSHAFAMALNNGRYKPLIPGYTI